MDYILTEIRLSRNFACEFEKFMLENPKLVPAELLESYIVLKKHYEDCMNRELS